MSVILMVALAGCGAPVTGPIGASMTPASGEFDLCAREAPCALSAGTYAPTVFRPPVRFVLGDGWSNELHVVDCITLFRKETEKLFLISGVGALGKEPADLVTFATQQGLAITSQGPVRVAGRQGLAVDVTTPTPKTLLTVAGMGLGIDPGQRARLIGIPGEAGLLVAMVRAPAADFDRFLGESQPVIDSLQLR